MDLAAMLRKKNENKTKATEPETKDIATMIRETPPDAAPLVAEPERVLSAMDKRIAVLRNDLVLMDAATREAADAMTIEELAKAHRDATIAAQAADPINPPDGPGPEAKIEPVVKTKGKSKDVGPLLPNGSPVRKGQLDELVEFVATTTGAKSIEVRKAYKSKGWKRADLRTDAEEILGGKKVSDLFDDPAPVETVIKSEDGCEVTMTPAPVSTPDELGGVDREIVIREEDAGGVYYSPLSVLYIDAIPFGDGVTFETLADLTAEIVAEIERQPIEGQIWPYYGAAPYNKGSQLVASALAGAIREGVIEIPSALVVDTRAPMATHCLEVLRSHYAVIVRGVR